MARFSRRKMMVEHFARVPNWMVTAAAPFLQHLKQWKKATRSSTMQEALLTVVSDIYNGNISEFVALVSTENEVNRVHITQQLLHYSRKVTGQQSLALGYAAQPQPLAKAEAVRYLANTLRIIRRKVAGKQERRAAKRTAQAQGSSPSNSAQTLHSAAALEPLPGAVGTFPLTIKGHLPPAPVFTTSHAWKARINQGYSDATTLGVAKSQEHTGTFQRWLQPWPDTPDLSCSNQRRIHEAAEWSLATILSTSEVVAIRWGALREAQQQVELKHGCHLDPEALEHFLWRQRLPTLGTSRSNHIILARLDGHGQVETRKALSGELISAMGVPANHSVRNGLCAVSENQAVSLVGQAVEVGSAKAACEYGLKRAHLTDATADITYGAAACGLDLIAVAMQQLRPNMRYLFAAEALEIPQLAHKRAWTGQAIKRFTLAHDHAQISLMPHTQVWAWTGRCNPYTRLSRRSPQAKAEAKQRAAEEMNAAFDYVRIHRPDVVVGENVAAFGTGGEGQVWRSFLAILHSAGQYDWAWQVLQPVQTDTDAAINRSRFWYVGVLRRC
jgi:hypothetical protein